MNAVSRKAEFHFYTTKNPTIPKLRRRTTLRFISVQTVAIFPTSMFHLLL